MCSSFRTREIVLLKSCALLCVMGMTVAVTQEFVAQDATPSSQNTTEEEGYIEELVVEGQLPDIGEMNEFEVTNYYNMNAKAGQLYKMRRYDEAKPLLEIGAQLGFKMSQARLGAIYAYGLGTTPADPIKGISWIGVAAEPKSDPAIRKEFSTLMKQIPKEHRGRVDAHVANQRAKYGSKSTGTKCSMNRSAGSQMSWLVCEVEDVYKFRSAADQYNLCLMLSGGEDLYTSPC